MIAPIRFKTFPENTSDTKEEMKMRTTSVAKIAILVLLIIGVTAGLGCDAARGGADIYIEGVTMGSMSMEGKPVTGLPSQKMNIVLNVNANKITISESDGETTITCSPSDATIVCGEDGIDFTGVDPEDVQIKWQETKKTK